MNIPTPYRVLVVDDDPSIAELMRDFLENDGFQVLTAGGAEEAFAIFQASEVHCLLLDVMMPGQDGFELCRRIRSVSETPILFLSARDDDVHKIRGLGIGGDDYIVKTASPSEVVARVKAVLRRTGAASRHASRVLDYGRLKLDLSTRELLVDGRSLSLTPKEYELLSLLSGHPRQVFTYEQLLDRLWEGVGDKHTVRVHIARLREKIELDANAPQYVTNVWGIGYRFEAKPV
ncbi:response regulator transcription factor [Cohnella thailandensis]|uniref:Response regulator transcription factor n=1 Tax=Cohnella thailandensis TaxID=557557 RepID=A0A841T0H8_9BACL|nr:response regulator transcription factor [Cohnella thailandensis]MBB6636589.1 response regulator transcription factor [Cohnella thailandensis]MBP1973538.1 DNA-binding response OmpR family regulator [Cohnella thailandensis]